jgi:hypothetical protein
MIVENEVVLELEQKWLHSVCHAGLDPASSRVGRRKATGFRIKSGMTKEQNMQF